MAAGALVLGAGGHLLVGRRSEHVNNAAKAGSGTLTFELLPPGSTKAENTETFNVAVASPGRSLAATTAVLALGVEGLALQ